MGDYNPHHPAILGLEWVPIHAETYPLSHSEEIGVTFHLTDSATLTSVGFVLDDPPAAYTSQTAVAAIYPAGLETATGPIRTVDLPVSGGTVTDGATVDGTVASALATPSDAQWVMLPTETAAVNLSFAVDGAVDLPGRRILNVELRYVAKKSSVAAPSSGTGLTAGLYSPTLATGLGRLSVTSTMVNATTIDTVDLGDLNPDVGNYTPSNLNLMVPWTFPQLRRLAVGATAPMTVSISGDTDVMIQYAALRVTYCDETRLAVGGRIFTSSAPAYVSGVNPTILWDPTTLTQTVTLPAGRYTATLTLGDHGPTSLLGPKPALPVLRQLHRLPTHEGIILSWASSTTPPTREVLDRLVPLVVATASGVVLGCHSYLRQRAVPVFGPTTATQVIPAGDTLSRYQLVRCYARRHGATSSALTIRNVADPTQAASIAPATFDTLPELVDGWREITLPLPGTGATLSAASSWEVLAPGETSANRWELLAAQVPTSGQAAATHGGETIRLTWDDPAVTGAAAADPTTDAVLTLIAGAPPITDLTVSPAIRALTPAPAGCGSESGRGVPAGLHYHHLTWAPPHTTAAADTFDRSVTAGWGSTPAGLAWSASGGTSTDYAVTAGTGTHLLTSTGVARRITLPVNLTHLEARCALRIPTMVTGARIEAGTVLRYQDADNHLRCMLDVNPDQTIGLRLVQVIAATTTTLATLTAIPGLPHVPATAMNLKTRAVGRWVHATAWQAGTPEPAGWQVSAPTTWVTAGQAGIRTMRVAGNTNANLTALTDDITITPVVPGFGGVELQRSDDLEPTWQTILRTSSPMLGTFDDYEARVGVTSRYQIRGVDRFGCPGDWSTVITSTLPTPGVTGSRAEHGVLLFTSNSRQDGTAALAYTTVFDRDLSREITFPEADTVTTQRMFGRDYQIAFHGTERGGQRWTRTLLIQPNTSGSTWSRLEELRDLAWADLPYLCVRDENGNRWLTAVTVPSAALRGRRDLLLAQIQIAEVTATPYPVDPAPQTGDALW